MSQVTAEKQSICTPLKNCIVCGGREFDTVLDLGDLHLNAFPLPGEQDPPKAPLCVVHCMNCHLLQLREVVDSDLLYREYWYRSGTNQTMRDALKDVVTGLPVKLEEGDSVADIGSNDNTLLDSYQTPGLLKFGWEPSNIAKECVAVPGTVVFNDYFQNPPRELYGKVKVVTSIAMFYGVRNPHPFVRDVKKILAPGGVWVLQLAYLPSILERNAFDGMCHEHVAYYSLGSLEHLLARHGLRVFDAKLIPSLNEGSIRLYVSRVNEGPDDSKNLKQIRIAERGGGLTRRETYEAFGRRVQAIRHRVRGFLELQRDLGKTVHGYGASTKGNTLLQYFGIGPDLVSAIWERQPQKWGRQTVGTRIPIISEDEGRKVGPKSLFVLPWHFIKEFKEREKPYTKNGGRLVVPLPEFEVLE